MVTHPAVGVVSFTGSTATGRVLAEKAGRNHQGRICMAGTRIIVEHSLAGALASQLVDKLATLKTGAPSDPETAIGPITSPTQLEKIQAHVDDAVAKGRGFFPVPRRVAFEKLKRLVAGVRVVRAELTGRR